MRSWWGPVVLNPKAGRGPPPPTPTTPCPVDREEADETTRCVAVLRPVKLREWIVEAHVRMGTIEQQMEALCCCRWSYYTWRIQAYDLLLGYFNDLGAGIPLPPINTNDDDA